MTTGSYIADLKTLLDRLAAGELDTDSFYAQLVEFSARSRVPTTELLEQLREMLQEIRQQQP